MRRLNQVPSTCAGTEKNLPGAIGAFPGLMREAALTEKIEKGRGLEGRDQAQCLAGLEVIDRVQNRHERRPARGEERAHVQFERRRWIHGWQYAVIDRPLP
jgi:hypothetical protein